MKSTLQEANERLRWDFQKPELTAAVEGQTGARDEAAAGFEAVEALREVLAGNEALAKQQARAALALANGRDVRILAGLALGLAGDSAQAGHIADELASQFPEDTLVQFVYLPTMRAAALPGGGITSGERAIEILAPARQYELGTHALPLYPAYLGGEAYWQGTRGSGRVSSEDYRSSRPGHEQLIGALAHLGIACICDRTTR
jgi:hypothetical protein